MSSFCWTMLVWGVPRVVSYSACKDPAAFTTTAIVQATFNKKNKTIKLPNILSTNCNKNTLIFSMMRATKLPVEYPCDWLI